MRDERKWTNEAIALLRLWWTEGATAETIGLRLGGMSRSAVLGKIFRLRLQTNGATRRAQGKREAPTGGVDDGLAGLARRRRRGGGRRKKIPAPPDTPTQRVTLLDLKNNSCRWPFGRPGSERFHFCGAPEADLERGIPYCARHMRRAYQQPAVASAPELTP